MRHDRLRPLRPHQIGTLNLVKVPWPVQKIGTVALLVGLIGGASFPWSAAIAQKATHAAPVGLFTDPETRLIEAQRLFAQGNAKAARVQVEKLIRDVPTFRAALLLYGDILRSQSQPVNQIGAVPEGLAKLAETTLVGLREESKARVGALKDAPPPGTIPSQFLELAAESKHAIAVDSSKSRLYLFENGPAGIRLVGNYYISVGKYGVGKVTEGDQRTPMGVYFVSRSLEPIELPTLFGVGFYGSGALTLNYPNPLDLRRGKTGGGIWLHGTPPTEFARIPRASDGCVVLANPDLERITKIVSPKSTPVVISERLQWVDPKALDGERQTFSMTLKQWEMARAKGDYSQLMTFYEANFYNGKNLNDWGSILRADIDKMRGKQIEISKVSFLRWIDKDDTMVVNYTESVAGSRQSAIKRHYWTRVGKQWKIFFEGTIG